MFSSLPEGRWTKIGVGKYGKWESVGEKARLSLAEVWTDQLITRLNCLAEAAQIRAFLDEKEAICSLCSEEGAKVFEEEWQSEENALFALRKLGIETENIW